MPRHFKTEEEKKLWGQKMKEARAKKRLERNSQAETPKIKPTNPSELPEIPGKVWVLHNSGDKLAVPEWLAQDLIKEGKAKRI